jgi:hypothetical protein
LKTEAKRGTTETPLMAQVSLDMPLDTTLKTEAKRATTETPLMAQVSLDMPLDTTLETNTKRRDANCREARKRRHI